MNILDLLKELAAASPYSHEIKQLVSGQPENIQELFKCNNSDALKNLISANQIYSNETTVTLY